MNRRSRRLVAGFAGAGALLCSSAAVSRQTRGIDTAPIRAEIQRIEESRSRIVDQGAALYLLARRYVKLGALDRAEALLRECAALEEGFEPDTANLAPLPMRPVIRAIAARFTSEHPPVHKARVSFTVSESDLFPEGLAFDPDGRSFYIGSELHKKVVRVDGERRVVDFVPPDRDHLDPVGGLRVDPVDGSLWVATDSAEFAHFDRGGRLIERYSTTDSGPHALNDLVVDRHGHVYLTDTSAHLVYRFDRGGRAFVALRVHRQLFYPNGITLSPDEHWLFVADSVGVVAVDLESGATRDVNPGPRSTLAGIDGLYWYDAGFVGVQYGTGAYRVMRWRLSADTQQVTSSEVLEYRTDLVKFPTTGAVVNDEFYFIANTGIDNLQDGRIVDRTKLEPIRIAVVALK